MKIPKETVREGYDKLSAAYREHFSTSHAEWYVGWLDDFEEALLPQSRVLELGCGDGIPAAQRLSKSYDYLA